VIAQPTCKSLFALLAAISLTSGCSAPPPKQSPPEHASVQSDASRQTLRDFIKCLIQHEPEMDDKVSDASTIALGLTNRCGPEYEAVTESGLVTNDKRLKQMWREQRSTREAKVEASLDIVLSMRRGAVPNPNF
jgi:hypothetical protein